MVEMACNIYNDLRLEKKFCDVLIQVDGGEFHGHKIILCGCSLYFKALFTNDCYPLDKNTYSIPGVSSEIMEMIMEYMYMQRVIITEDNVRELIIAADYLAVRNLVNECCMFLKDQISLMNCIGIWHFANFYFYEKLKQQAFRFILHNFEQLVHFSVEFRDLTGKQLIEIIKNDELNVKNEKVVFEAILKWVEYAPLERKAHMGILLPKVRLALLPHEYFIEKVKNNGLVTDSVACKPTITRVLIGTCGIDLNIFITADLRRLRLPITILLAIGGWSHGAPTNAIEAYDFQAECWVDVTCEEESPRAYHGAVYLNGFVYCIGGFDRVNYFSSVRRFNPITRTWAQVGPMHCCRCYVNVCVLDGCIYAMGGFDGNERLKTAERYEPETNQWNMIAPMNERRSDASATSLNGKVYICGGFDGNDYLFTAEFYSPETNQWTFIPRMSSRRSGLGVITYAEKMYVVGGFDGVNRLRRAEVYDPESDSWADISDMNTQRSNFGIEVLDNLLFVVGGYNGFHTTSKSEFYDKETDEWYDIEDIGVFRSGLSCCVLSGLPNIAQYAAPREAHFRFHQSSLSTRHQLTAAADIGNIQINL